MSIKTPGRKAFTIMEVLVVLMIVSIMSSIIMPTYSGFQATEQAFAEAAKLVADFRMARYRSIEYQCYTRLRFSSGGDGWFVEELYDKGTSEPVDGEPAFLPSDVANWNANYEWKSIIGEEMREMNPEITMAFKPDPPPEFCFRPDGVIIATASFYAPPIAVTEIGFYFGDIDPALSQAASITITPAGTVESRAYYREDY